jgi:GTP-binding protein
MNIRSATFQISAPDLSSCPVSELPEFAFIGRSNVGKSSLLNLLVGGKDLAKVSPTPGHTQLINFFSMDKTWSLVDLPGYGFAKAGKMQLERFQEMIATYLTGRKNLACVFVLIDCRHAPQQIDLDFLEWLMDAGVALALVFTKTDLSKTSQVEKNIDLFESQISAWGREIPVVFTSSAKTRSGRLQLLEFIEQTIGIRPSPPPGSRLAHRR